MIDAISSQGRRVLPSLVPVEREPCRSEVILAKERERNRLRRLNATPEQIEARRGYTRKGWAKYRAREAARRQADPEFDARLRAQAAERAHRQWLRNKADPEARERKRQICRDWRLRKRLARDLERLIAEASLNTAGH